MPATGDGQRTGAESRSSGPAATDVRQRVSPPCPGPGAAPFTRKDLDGLEKPGAAGDLAELNSLDGFGGPTGRGPHDAAALSAPGAASVLSTDLGATLVPSSGSLPLPGPRATDRPGNTDRSSAPLKLLVIESDTSDAKLIEELVAASGTPVELYWARGLSQAATLLAPPSGGPGRRGRTRPVEFSCVLVDLAAGLSALPSDHADTGPGDRAAADSPAADPLDGLRDLLRRAPHTAVVVLTDAADAQLGPAAVAAGAQDFLIKTETDGPLLARALRYAVERKRADESQRRLVEAELRGQENARLQRHLLPTPLLDGANLSFTRRYRPGRRRALLGGDFYDAVRTDDGSVHVVIGDVCGHGPDEAALGVALRIAWRTLVFAGLTGQTLLTTLQHVLEHERRSDEIFATLCMLVISPEELPDQAAPSHGRSGGNRGGRPPAARSAEADRPAREHAEVYLAGHPAPLLMSATGRPVVVPAEHAGPALGLLPCDDVAAGWPPYHLDLEPGWSLLLYTDGLIEGRVGAGSRRLGQDGLVGLIGDHQAGGLSRGRLVDSAIAEVEELNGGALTDDVAVLLLERNPAPLLMG
ncbi:PP2C family protein-serine/threonine phosphatase [Kitasatospora sp. NPDC052896]|uniref:PP2C family protein-serine/threonine phosphatase n=1 Tax=Kitasatospora sp. NPDC052896 TaxID=3364061 RepID=UPI0037C5AF47